MSNLNLVRAIIQKSLHSGYCNATWSTKGELAPYPVFLEEEVKEYMKQFDLTDRERGRMFWLMERMFIRGYDRAMIKLHG